MRALMTCQERVQDLEEGASVPCGEAAVDGYTTCRFHSRLAIAIATRLASLTDSEED